MSKKGVIYKGQLSLYQIPRQIIKFLFMLINIDYFTHGLGRFRHRYDHKTVVHQRKD